MAKIESMTYWTFRLSRSLTLALICAGLLTDALALTLGQKLIEGGLIVLILTQPLVCLFTGTKYLLDKRYILALLSFLIVLVFGIISYSLNS